LKAFIKTYLLQVGVVLCSVALTSGGIFSCPAIAMTQSFECSVVDGIPTTVANTSRGAIPVIRWKSNNFDNAGWPAAKRCKEVSKKFQQYFETGQLNYLTTGKVNGQNVVCTADKKGGDCIGLLFTIRPNHSPSETLRKLMLVRVVSDGPLQESPPRLYIDLEEILSQREPI
jgi:hypothetical protein